MVAIRLMAAVHHFQVAADLLGAVDQAEDGNNI